MRPTSPSRQCLHLRPGLDMSCVEHGQEDWMGTRPTIKSFCLFSTVTFSRNSTGPVVFPLQDSVTTVGIHTIHVQYELVNLRLVQLVHVTGQYSESLFHCCQPSASLESNLVTRSHTYSALFLLWDHTQCRWFCICCITEISQQFPSNNVIFSGKSIRLIMKQGEESKQRQLGDGKETLRETLSVAKCSRRVQRAVTAQQQPKLILNKYALVWSRKRH